MRTEQSGSVQLACGSSGTRSSCAFGRLGQQKPRPSRCRRRRTCLKHGSRRSARVWDPDSSRALKPGPREAPLSAAGWACARPRQGCNLEMIPTIPAPRSKVTRFQEHGLRKTHRRLRDLVFTRHRFSCTDENRRTQHDSRERGPKCTGHASGQFRSPMCLLELVYLIPVCSTLAWRVLPDSDCAAKPTSQHSDRCASVVELVVMCGCRHCYHAEDS